MSDQNVEAFLAHYGVKGMKWGQRKSDVSSARRSLAKTGAKLSIQQQKALGAKSSSAKSAAVKEMRKIAKEELKTGNASTGAKLTAGEKAVHVVLFGPLALGTIPLTQLSNRKTDERLLKNYANAKVSDF